MVHILLAKALMKTPAVNYEEVLAQLALEEKAAPGDPDIYLQRGRVHLARDRFADAAVAFERAILLRPMEPGAYYLLATTYQRVGRTEAANAARKRFELLKSERP